MKLVAVSCGEPAGIGPEITVKAHAALGADCPMLWIGDPRHLPQGTAFTVVDTAAAAATVPHTHLPVLALDMGPAPRPGHPEPSHAAGVIAAIERGVDLVRSGACAGLCTAPIHKKALADGAGFAHPGHTEFLAALGGVDEVVMMLACDALRVVPATIHIPLSAVPETLTATKLENVLRITRDALIRDFQIPEPRIAICGLNPHAGEGGKMGHEELTMIGPLLEQLRAQGMILQGPLPADTMFHAAARARYDAAVAMYHDQALIPIKTLDFAGGVNVTLGLPFIRTSPDHGTAFDIAGQNLADPGPMIAALKMAQELGARRAAGEPHGRD